MEKNGEESNQDIEGYVELNELELVRRIQKYLLKERLLGVLGEIEYEVVEMRWGGRETIAECAKIVEMKSLRNPRGGLQNDMSNLLAT